MSLREVIANLRQMLPNLVTVAAVIAGAIAVIWFLPGRTAAILLAIAMAALLTFYVLRNMQRGTRIALLWLAIGISADAAYARVNDQTPVTIATALRLSCNIPFAELAVELGDDAIRAEAEKYGFNSQFSMPLQSAASTYPASPNAPQTALSGFGQGDVRATPLQMAMVSAGIANGGVVMNPRMVDRVIEPNLSVTNEGSNSEFGRAIEPDVASQMVAMMTANVQDGAASNARIDGVQVAGKTGTAENDSRPYTLWFTGFAPAEDPRVAVAVVVENGGGQGQSGSGNEIAAPIAKKVMEAVLGI